MLYFLDTPDDPTPAGETDCLVFLVFFNSMVSIFSIGIYLNIFIYFSHQSYA